VSRLLRPVRTGEACLAGALPLATRCAPTGQTSAAGPGRYPLAYPAANRSLCASGLNTSSRRNTSMVMGRTTIGRQSCPLSHPASMASRAGARLRHTGRMFPPLDDRSHSSALCCGYGGGYV